MKVTFCITCWRRDVYLLDDRLFDIYHKQTSKPDEVLVIVSGVDKIPATKYAQENNLKIKFFRNQMLAGGARNKGAELAGGDIVCFCDVDDPIHPQKCQIMRVVFSERDIDAVVHNYQNKSKDFIKIEKNQILQGMEEITEYGGGSNVSAPSKMPIAHGPLSGRKEIFEDLKYLEDIGRGEDGLFCNSIVDSEYSLFYLPHCLINY